MEPGTSVNGGEEELALTSELLQPKATYRCPLCPKRFIPRSLSEVGRLHWHLLTDHNVLNQAKDHCPICGTMYSTRWYIQKHIRDVHFQPPRSRGILKNSGGAKASLHGPLVRCRFCLKDISKSFIAVHLRAHYNKTTLLSSVNAQPKLVSQSQEKNSDCSEKSSQSQYEPYAKKENIDEICLTKYSIYDLLGTYGKHYQAIKHIENMVIQLFKKEPSDAPSKDVKLYDHKIISTPLHNDNNVITLDSDSDESQPIDLVCDPQNGDGDIVLSDDDNDRSNIYTLIGPNSGHTPIRIVSVKSMSATSESKCERRDKSEGNDSDSGADVVNKITNGVDTSADVVDISADVVDISADEGDVGVGEETISADVNVGEEHIIADERDVDVDEEDVSADEEDIVAELEQYIEDTELMEELNSVNSADNRQEHLPQLTKDSAPSEANSVGN